MSQPTQFEGWPVGPVTGGTKIDSYSSHTAWGGLAGNQRVAQHISHQTEHLRWSPAGGAPTHESEFSAGHRWTEAEGKVHDGTGPSNLGW